MIKPIVGKKVILFELQKADVPAFASAHREDKHGYMQAMNLSKMTPEQAEQYVFMLLSSLQMIAFVVMTNEGKATRKVGYVYINDLSAFGCSISGIMTKDFSAGLARQLKRGKYTYSEDAMRTLIAWLYENFKTLDRIQADVVVENRLSLALVARVGFRKEGVLRNYLHLDDKAVDVVVHSILRSEWRNDDELVIEKTNTSDPAVQPASPALV